MIVQPLTLTLVTWWQAKGAILVTGENAEEEIPIELVQVGDTLKVRP